MEIHIVIGVLLACTVAGLPVKDEVLPDDIFTPPEHALFEVPHVFDDNGNLVKLDLDRVSTGRNLNEDEIAKRVVFFLYKKNNPNPKQIYVNDENVLKNSNFDPTKPTRIITHGWMNSRKSSACTSIRDAYLQYGDYNVIVIDWSSISINVDYIWASRQVVQVGRFVSTMINFLVEHGMDPLQITMVGHSLGAHVVGIAARNTNSKIGYIVGLDPAFPEFRLAGPGARISSGDAKYVEIIHTNAGLLGFLPAIGDVDFYPNGGMKQHGCLVDVGGACSHARSYWYFAESINSPVGFQGKSCSSFLRFKMGLCNHSHTSIMGGHKPLFSASGTYYLVTNPSFPFAVRR